MQKSSNEFYTDGWEKLLKKMKAKLQSGQQNYVCTEAWTARVDDGSVLKYEGDEAWMMHTLKDLHEDCFRELKSERQRQL